MNNEGEKLTNGTLKKPMRIKPLNIKTLTFSIIGITPYGQQKFSKKTLEAIKVRHEKGSPKDGTPKKQEREPKNFQALYEASIHNSTDGWRGIPAAAFRNSMIDVCRTSDVKMTMAKMTVFVKADGYDKDDGMPLVRITKGEPHKVESPVRLKSGEREIHARALWDSGWEATIQVQYDADQFSSSEIMNLVNRAGYETGIGEGRNFGHEGNGIGWGSFERLRGSDVIDEQGRKVEYCDFIEKESADPTARIADVGRARRRGTRARGR